MAPLLHRAAIISMLYIIEYCSWETITENPNIDNRQHVNVSMGTSMMEKSHGIISLGDGLHFLSALILVSL